MQNKPNFSKSQVFITVVLTRNYNEKSTMDTWSKQTQTNPILSRAQSRDLLKQLQSLATADLPQGKMEQIIAF